MSSGENQKEHKGELETNLEFVQEAKEGEYAAVDLDSLKYLRFYETAEHINPNESDYYYNFV